MKRCLVTGASGGIGLAVAKRLAKDGWQLTLVARNEAKLRDIADALPGAGHQCLGADLATDDGVRKVGNHLGENHYDALVNNAGVGLYGGFESIDIAEQSKMLALNCAALVDLSYRFLNNARSGDSLINVGSILGESGCPGAAAYAGTKGFVNRFSESLWYEFRDRDIFVASVAPGATATDFHESSGGDASSFPKAMLQTPEQVAEVVVGALQRRNKPLFISGRLNKMMLFSGRLASRKQLATIMGGFRPDK